MRRLLLPFTHGVDTPAIEQAIQFARESEATLVVLSLIRTGEKSSRPVRVELIQQSKDFQVFVRHKARRAGVGVEQLEFYSHNTLYNIRAIAREMACSAIMLFSRDGKGILLGTTEVQHMLLHEDLPLVLMCLPSRAHNLKKRLPSWVNRLLARPATLSREPVQVQNILTTQEKALYHL